MSVATAADAVEPGAGAAPGNAVDAVNDHTPDPETPPVVDAVPDPPMPQDGIAELREVVAGLAATVATLTDLVTDKERDASPASLPWTHRGGHHAGDDE